MTTLIFESVCLWALVSPAATVEETRVRTAASSYVRRNYAPAAIAKSLRRLPAAGELRVVSVRPITGVGGVIGYVAELSPSGFAVLRADDDLPPLKMHSAQGSYASLPAGIRAVVEAELAGELAELTGGRQTKRASDGRHRAAWRNLTQAAEIGLESLSLAASLAQAKDNEGAVLLTTKWSQASPYNTYFPAASGGSGGRALVGCGPLALAQILRFHKQPVSPVQDAVDTDLYGACAGTYRVSDVGGLGPYDWDNMPDSLSASSPLVKRHAVGRLTYHCGVALQADFEAGGTSVSSYLYAARALREVFGYTCEDYQSKTAYTSEDWLAKIRRDIDADCPVYYTMVSSLGGHAVVCDGYRNETEIHLNFGSSGYGDAWYNVDSVVFYGYLWGWHEGVFGITAPVSSTNEPPVIRQVLKVVNPGAVRVTVGVAVKQALEIVSESPAEVTVTGLPAGLKYDVAAKAITGVPKVAVTNKTVTVTATNVDGEATERFLMTAEPLPEWAQGSFNGWFEHGELGDGLASVAVTRQGQVTGKLSAGGTNYSFSAASYAWRDGDGALWVSVDAKNGSQATLSLLFKVSQAERGAEAEWLPETLSALEGWFSPLAEGGPEAALYRNVWKEPGMAAVLANRFAGYYTAALPAVSTAAAPVGSGFLTFTVDKAGAVKTAGRLADGQAVSLSGTLVADVSGRTWTVLAAAPAAYQGGQFFGVAELVKPADGGAVILRPLDGSGMAWTSRNPQATADFGVGFARETALAGGWYDKAGNLYAYYAGQTLTVGTGGTADAPEIIVGGERYGSVCWNPSGVALTPKLQAGVMTGLTAPVAASPVRVNGEWVYDAAANTVGLTFAVSRATGLYSGSFRAWFDVGASHRSKNIAFRGVLTPVREDLSDGVEGCGFFLWADKAVIPATGKAYGFSWSYDFSVIHRP